MIADPHNDFECLGALTEDAIARVVNRDPVYVAWVAEHNDTESLAESLRAKPQRDDNGDPDDGPKLKECHPWQRLRVLADDPNCFERTRDYLVGATLLDPCAVRRAATVKTPSGMHTFPTEDGEPVILDPRQTRNALRAGLFRAEHERNGTTTALTLTPTQAVDWIAELAAEPAERFAEGARRVRNGHAAATGVLVGRPICIADARDVAFVLALAEREARLYGPAGPRIVKTTAHALDRLDRLAAERWKQRTEPRNLELRIGGKRISPNLDIFGALARIGGRIGGKIGVEALKIKLASLGLGAPVLNSIEQELKQEGMSLGPLAKPPPIVGSLGALTPEAIAGRWIARKL